MRKTLKIAFITFAVLIIVAITSFSLIMFDVAGSLATESKALPNGAAIGKALVVYDPGLTGTAKGVATKTGYRLQESGYDVTLAGVRSSAAAQIAGYSVIVVGGPIYAGSPASSIQSYLDNLDPTQQTRVGAFGCGSLKLDNGNTTVVIQEVAPLPSGSSVTLRAVMKVSSGDDQDSLSSSFVSTLLK